MGIRQAGHAFADAITQVISSGTFELGSPVDELGAGVNMTEGTIHNWSSARLASHTVIAWKGADNGGTRLTGISSAGITPNMARLFVNISDSGVDAGMVVLEPENAGSLAANRIKTPGNRPVMIPNGDGCWMVYGEDDRWHYIGGISAHALRARIADLRLFPNVVMTSLANGSTHNDWDPTPLSTNIGGPPPTNGNFWGGSSSAQDYTVWRVPVDAGSATITGIAHGTGDGGDPDSQGNVKILLNEGPGNLVLKHLNAGSTVTNRMYLPNAQDITLKPGEACTLISPLGDTALSGDSQWRVFGLGIDVSNITSTTITKATIAVPRSYPLESPAALGSLTTTNDLDRGGDGRIVRVTTHANGSYLGGLAPRYTGVGALTDGEEATIVNVGSGPLVLLDEDAGSTYKFELPGARPFVLESRGAVDLWRESTGNWKIRGTCDSRHRISITPAALAAANIDDWAPTDATTGFPFKYCGWARIQGAVGTVIRSINPVTHGQRVVLSNYASGMTIKHASATGTTGKLIYCPGGVDFVLHTYASVELEYDGLNSAWMVLGAHDGGA